MPNLINSLVNGAINGVVNDAIKSNPQLAQMQNMLMQARRSGNPQAFVQQMLRQNPQIANQLMSMLGSQDPQQVAMTMAQQSGIDPSKIVELVNK